MNDALRIGVIGAGAIGCWVGGRLALAGADVVLYARPRHVSTLAGGLTLVGLGGGRAFVPTGRYRVVTEAAALAECEVLLVCVKSGQTDEVATLLAPVAARDALVVSLQNGVGNAARLRATLGEARVLGGLVGFNVVQDGATFHQGTTGTLVLEDRDDRRLDRLAGALRDGGVDVERRAALEPVQWTKLLMNLNNALGALSDAPTRDLLFVGGYRRSVRAVMAEGLAVLARAGITPVKLGPLPPRWFPAVLGLPSPLFRIVARAQLRIDPAARSSMWQDVAAGRPTEVDHLNGAIVALADRAGTRAPLNARIVTLIHEVERAGRGSPKLSPDALWAALHA